VALLVEYQFLGHHVEQVEFELFLFGVEGHELQGLGSGDCDFSLFDASQVVAAGLCLGFCVGVEVEVRVLDESVLDSPEVVSPLFLRAGFLGHVLFNGICEAFERGVVLRGLPASLLSFGRGGRGLLEADLGGFVGQRVSFVAVVLLVALLN
jgi:hypothetical protein